eukprot:6204885-Pleurochrysis_carterae.AAC.4
MVWQKGIMTPLHLIIRMLPHCVALSSDGLCPLIARSAPTSVALSRGCLFHVCGVTLALHGASHIA